MGGYRYEGPDETVSARRTAACVFAKRRVRVTNKEFGPMSEQDQMNALAAQLPIGAHALHGVLSGGQPEPEHVALLAGAHIHTVLDLRLPEEERGYDEAATVAHAGMEYLNIPVGPAGPDDAAYDKAREVLRDAGRRPILIHCKSANRVGAVVLPYLILDEGHSEAEAVEIATAAGLKVPALRESALAYVARHRG